MGCTERNLSAKLHERNLKEKLSVSRSSALKKLGIQFPIKTDPHHMANFFRLTGLFVLLRDPKNPGATKSVELLKTLIHLPISFEPVSNGIMVGIDKNPLLKEAIFSESFPDKKSTLFEDKKYHLAYYLLVLEVIVRLMLNDIYFYAHVMDSFSETDAISNYKKSFSTVLKGALEFSDPFIGIKIASVAPLLKHDLDDRENTLGSPVNKSLGINGLSLNISQAVARDRSELNKRLGLVLIARLQGTSVKKKYTAHSTVLSDKVAPFDFWRTLYSHVQPGNKVLCLPQIDERWNDLYIIWNLIFVLRNYPQYAVFFFAKLCIPSVLNAREEFLIARVYAIWVSFFVVENIMRHATFFSVLTESKNKILDAWERRIVDDAIAQSPFSVEALNGAAEKLKRFNVTSAPAMFSTANGKLFSAADQRDLRAGRMPIQ